MTFTLAEFSRFTHCPQIYALHDIQGVPMPPTTRQVIGNVVRKAIAEELADNLNRPIERMATELRASIQAIATEEMAQDIAYTDDELHRGQRTAYERVLRSSLALMNMWRVTCAPRIQPMEVNKPFSAFSLTGEIEIVEATGPRLTRVRQRNPGKNDATNSITVAVYMAASGKQVTVDYLIEPEATGVAGALRVDRQVVEYDPAKVCMVRERAALMAKCCEVGLYPPTDTAYWRCQLCSLRTCCRFV